MSAHRYRPRLECLEDRAVPATFYVATTGSDAAAGSSAAPWRTLQHAADRVAAGDTVVVRAGSYQGFYLTADGAAGAPITFRADPGVVVDRPNPTTPDGINLEGADWVVVEGFRVVSQPRTGIRSVLNHHATIRGNVCDQNGSWGILTGWSENLLIENNVCSRSVSQHGIYVSNSADNPVVRDNTVWGNFASGIQLNGDVYAGGTAATPGDGVISNARVENNVIYGNGALGGASINCDGVQGAVIRNNLIYDAHASGIVLYRSDGGGGSTGNLVVNNTVLVAADGRWAVYIDVGSTGNVLRNNVLHSAHPFAGAIAVSRDSLRGFVSDYNLTEDRFSTTAGDTVLTLAQWRSRTRQDGNSLTTSDPGSLFVNAAGGDYHLRPGSPAIDRGTAAGAPATDYEGDARPQGAGVDIGHDEFRPA